MINPMRTTSGARSNPSSTRAATLSFMATNSSEAKFSEESSMMMTSAWNAPSIRRALSAYLEVQFAAFPVNSGSNRRRLPLSPRPSGTGRVGEGLNTRYFLPTANHTLQRMSAIGAMTSGSVPLHCSNLTMFSLEVIEVSSLAEASSPASTTNRRAFRSDFRRPAGSVTSSLKSRVVN